MNLCKRSSMLPPDHKLPQDSMCFGFYQSVVRDGMRMAASLYLQRGLSAPIEQFPCAFAIKPYANATRSHCSDANTDATLGKAHDLPDCSPFEATSPCGSNIR
jgi:hypothetical protein